MWTWRFRFQDWIEILVLHHKLGKVISESLTFLQHSVCFDIFVALRMLDQEWHCER